MYDLFYIVEVSPQWYNLCLSQTHYCLACGSDLESFKRTMYSYVRKYKTEDRVYSAMRRLTDGGRVCATTYNKRSEDYKSGKHLVFNSLVRGVVAQALKDNREDTPYNRVKKRVGAVTPVGVAASKLPPANKTTTVERVVGKITPHKIKRTITI